MIPTIVIIIPTLNEEYFIGSCLESVYTQTFPSEQMEVLVVDGGSSDRTRYIVLDWMMSHRNLHLFDNNRKIQAAAFNIGVKNSKSPIVVRMDAHALYPPEYLEKCVKMLRAYEDAGEVGGIFNIKPSKDTLTAGASAIVNKSCFGTGGATYRRGANKVKVDIVPFGAYPRTVLDKIGPMREDLKRTEDNEYASRIRKAGYKIYLNPEIVCTYYARDTFMGSVHQMYANGVSIGHLFYVDRSAIGLRHFVPFVFVMSLLFSGIGGCFWHPLWLVTSLILLLYFAAATIASALECSKYGWRYFFVLIALFFSVHISYGWGTLVGLIKYATVKNVYK